VLEFNFNYEVLSAIAGMTFWNFYFQLFPQSIRSAQVIEFLQHLKRYLRRPVLVIWDRLSAHKSRMTQHWIAEQKEYLFTSLKAAQIQLLKISLDKCRTLDYRKVDESVRTPARG